MPSTAWSIVPTPTSARNVLRRSSDSHRVQAAVAAAPARIRRCATIRPAYVFPAPAPTDRDPLRPNTESDYRLILNRDVLPVIGRQAAGDVTRQQVVELVNRVAERGATRRADMARVVVSSNYGFGIDRGLVQHNPAKDLRNRHAYQPRDKVASVEAGRAPGRGVRSTA